MSQAPVNPPFVHPSAIVDPGAQIGAGTRIWHFCHISTGARIGDDCVLGQNVYVAGTAVIGHRCKIQNNVSLYDGVILSDEVFVGPSAVFTNVINPRAAISRKHEFHATIVEEGATVGANATIVCGNRIGAYAFVAAGAVVTHDVQPYALVAGVPARPRGWVCRCGLTLPARVRGGRLLCAGCGAQYLRRGRGKNTELVPVSTERPAARSRPRR